MKRFILGDLSSNGRQAKETTALKKHYDVHFCEVRKRCINVFNHSFCYCMHYVYIIYLTKLYTCMYLLVISFWILIGVKLRWVNPHLHLAAAMSYDFSLD